MKLAAKFFAAMAILGALCMSCPTPGTAAPARPNYQMQPWGQNVTPEQWQQAQQIFNESYGQMEQTRQALAAKRMELDQVLAMPNPDRGKIESLSREIGELRGKMLAARVETRDRLASQGLPPDCFAMHNGPRGENWNGGPCWYGNNAYNGNWNGWGHHGGHRGHGGPRSGCWR